ncbi:hypothetical protein [Proteiniphilum sp. UBA5384]|uniref:hypothetical protein n=1 Tax=Proteiniphilum sp. UBA5384 TaxID=1947279 RepID=UPI0025E163DF|nr:hypothetical protein [Proteiniphilum sp. UBA5384]
MNDIDNLLEKYFNGISSTEEEKKLKNYFKGKGILSEHEIYKPLFAAFDAEKEIKAPGVALPEKKTKKLFLPRRTMIWIAGSVAVALLIITFSTFHPVQKQNVKYVVIVNGKKITNQQKAQHYAESMFGEAKKIVESSYQPLQEATNIKEELDARNILKETAKNIEDIKTNYPQ